MIWEEMTYDTIDGRSRHTVFINVAAIEQHGHLPVGTDALAGQHILQQLHGSIRTPFWYCRR